MNMAFSKGVVTPVNPWRGIAGDFSEHDESPRNCRERADGSFLLDGALPIDRMVTLLRVPLPEQSDYHTVAGFALGQVWSAAENGRYFRCRRLALKLSIWTRRIDKILVTRQTGE